MTTPTNSNKSNEEWKPKHPREYRLFRIWKAIPIQFKTEELLDTELFDDDDLRQVVKVRTQAELAVVLGVGEDTISDWNTRAVPKEYRDIDFHIWADALAKDVVMAVYDQAVKTGKAPEAKLFLQITTGFAERTITETTAADEVLDDVRDIADSLRSLMTPPVEEPVDEPVDSVDNVDV